ncbi:MAG: GyrI-like domain-containing protein [Candidatus Cloacimonetes bacterium]|nr:GyrI-like domain-containing protein [Candidatus Cloacimonadota bacterium]MBL7085847.1 GyrI-like domain-containing protein [Candidatus Cloacimonadota bacterium]
MKYAKLLIIGMCILLLSCTFLGVSTKQKVLPTEEQIPVKIVKKEAMTIVGMQIRTSLGDNKVPKLWMKFSPRENEIKHVINPSNFWGVSFDYEYKKGDTEFSHIVGREVTSTDDIPDGMTFIEIPVSTYAVFTHKGSLDSLGKTYNYIFSQWIPQNKYKYDESAPQLELYDERFQYGLPDSEMDIYVPIIEPIEQ